MNYYDNFVNEYFIEKSTKIGGTGPVGGETKYVGSLPIHRVQDRYHLGYRGDNIKTPPLDNPPPLEKNPGFWKILKPRRKNSRAKRAKNFGLFLGCFSRQNGPKTVKAWKILKPRAEHFGKFGKY